jgi:predicted RNA-binding protein with PIN domain
LSYYLIDGYNFLFRLNFSKEKSLQQKRDSLIACLNEFLIGFRGKCCIVFDSSEQIREFPQCLKQSHLEVIYAPKGSTADTYIIELVEHHEHPKTITVVSSDTGLTRQCQHLGSQTMTIDEFISFICKKSKKSPSCKTDFKDTKQEIERLRKIFEDH